MAPQMRQVTTFCRVSEQRTGGRGSSSSLGRAGSAGSGGVIERSPGSLETHFPFPQNERNGRRPGREGAGRGGTDDDDCVVGWAAAVGANQKRSKEKPGGERG